MQLHFLGAAREVTGSLFLLETDAGSLLIDCGMVQGRRAESDERNRRVPRAAVAADAAILTHAHIDHSGNLPTLVRRGFKGAIHATPATRDVVELMLADSARIQAADAEYLNRKFADDPGWREIVPLYDEDDVSAAMKRFVAHSYHAPFEPLPGVQARFYDSGHILGSAQLVLDVDTGRDFRRIVFSGDLGRAGLPVLRDPEALPGPIDYAVMESTYGNRVHASPSRMHADLEEAVRRTVARGGTVVIPAFALGRTQEILLVLAELKQAGRLPDVPVYVDSPLASSVTAVFRKHVDCYDKETRAYLAKFGDPFDFPGVRYISLRQDSIALNDRSEPCILLSASGMAESGRILHHLLRTVEDPRNTVLVVGFMAAHTLGRRLVERHPRLRILGMERELRAEVVVLDAFSAHADRDGLTAWARGLGPELRTLYLVHGEPDQQEPLRRRLVEAGRRVVVPERGQVVELD